MTVEVIVQLVGPLCVEKCEIMYSRRQTNVSVLHSIGGI